MNRYENAFTLVELLVVMGLFLIVLAVAFPTSIDQLQRTEVSSEAKKVASSLFSVQQEAYTGKGNTSHGIKFSADKYETFSGSSYATGTGIDTYEIPNGLSINNITLSGGGTELYFPQGSFRSNKAGSIRVTDGINSYSVSINNEGLIELEKL